ncbi:hypothetical protein FSARC_12738 [Fusarium sarcochroum]|uniref:Mid2 domain-containing protein n=1 Tax=Fusarium sarcochroum TaxID=1208366 RepID=A0A8H4T6E5_9HYPO|nr:hypothetical protein FSARC_12738 [Fusarium sarcochroum]
MANQVDQESAADLVKDQANSPSEAISGSAPSPTSNPGDSLTDGGKTKGGKGSLSDGSDDDDTEAIEFGDNFKDGRVFKIKDGVQKDIGFTVNDTVTPIEVTWEATNGSMSYKLGAGQFKGFKRTGQLMSVSNNSVSLNFTFASGDKQWYGDDMFIRIDWQTEWASGYTKTPLFTVTESSSERVVEDLGDQLDKDDRDEGPLESIIPEVSSTSSDAQATSSSGIEDSDSSSGGGGGGLSTGAKAGIAVGAVIGGLLIFGALAFFLLRRRRRNKKPGDEYITQQTYAVDKETHGRATDSPNSPYSDENHMQPVAIDNIDRDRGAPATPPPGRSSIGSHGRGSNGAQTPQGMNTNVAHLVEDGMTADEIRRLEEEERQLDDEIERAARR